MSEDLPQLHMIRRDLRNLPDLQIPRGYALRNITPGDLEVWTALLHENHGFGDWPIERSLPLFGANSDVVFGGSYFVTREDEPVAAALLHHQNRRAYAPLAELGWVAASPRHQGHGLGYLVCLAVLRAAATIGDPAIALRTEDFRLPAIYTYLKLGFEPWYYDPRTIERWEGILRQLDWPPKLSR